MFDPGVGDGGEGFFVGIRNRMKMAVVEEAEVYFILNLICSK